MNLSKFFAPWNEDTSGIGTLMACSRSVINSQFSLYYTCASTLVLALVFVF
jgi:hypothetical protein